MVKFLRRIWSRYSKLGKRRKKKQFWRKPTGIHNKMRKKRKGYPAVVSIGYRKDKKISGRIRGKEPKMVSNIKDLEGLKKNEIIILSHMGKKKRIEISKKAKEKGLEIYNLNIKKFLLKNLEKKNEPK